jgi:PncC family amidohydrolase
MTVCTAESCTGGLIASSFVEKSGASSVYNEGFITYSNESKVRNLHVDKDLLDNYGAVSAEVAKAMAKGALELTGVDYSISVTGIAGPTGGSDEKPVGLVYIGIGTPSNMYVYEHRFLGNRDKVRDQAAKHALIHLWDLL